MRSSMYISRNVPFEETRLRNPTNISMRCVVLPKQIYTGKIIILLTGISSLEKLRWDDSPNVISFVFFFGMIFVSIIWEIWISLDPMYSAKRKKKLWRPRDGHIEHVRVCKIPGSYFLENGVGISNFVRKKCAICVIAFKYLRNCL